MSPTQRILRSIAAVVIGYLVFALSAVVLFQVTHHDPHAPQSTRFMIGTVADGIVFAALGGYVAARIAPDRHRRHAALVAVVIAVGAIVSIITSPPGSTWTQWSALILMAPCAYIGGLRAPAKR